MGKLKSKHREGIKVDGSYRGRVTQWSVNWSEVEGPTVYKEEILSRRPLFKRIKRK